MQGLENVDQEAFSKDIPRTVKDGESIESRTFESLPSFHHNTATLQNYVSAADIAARVSVCVLCCPFLPVSYTHLTLPTTLEV